MTSNRAYFAAIAAVIFISNWVIQATLGENTAAAVIALLIWCVVVLDVKFVPKRISVLQRVLPGLVLKDLILFGVVCSGMAVLAYSVPPRTSANLFLFVFLAVAALSIAFASYAFVSWRRWRQGRK